MLLFKQLMSIFAICMVGLSISKVGQSDMTKFGNSGFSLIEVLVSILVLAVGVIGAAGMQLTALRTTQQSAFQTAALQLAAEMADAIRAIDRWAAQNGHASLLSAVDYQSAIDGNPPAPAKLCYASKCDAEELVEYELYEWKSRVNEALPGGRMLICRDSAAWDSGKKSLTWDCSGGSESTTPLVIKLGWQAKNPDGSLIKDASNVFPPSVAIAVEPSAR